MNTKSVTASGIDSDSVGALAEVFQGIFAQFWCVEVCRFDLTDGTEVYEAVVKRCREAVFDPAEFQTATGDIVETHKLATFAEAMTFVAQFAQRVEELEAARIAENRP